MKKDTCIADVVLCEEVAARHVVELHSQASWQPDGVEAEEAIPTIRNLRTANGQPAPGHAEVSIADLAMLVDVAASFDFFCEEELDLMQATLGKATVRNQLRQMQEDAPCSCTACRELEEPADDESFSLQGSTPSVH